MKQSMVLSLILIVLSFIFGRLYAMQANKIMFEFNIELKFSWRSNREYSRTYLKTLMKTDNIDLRKQINRMFYYQNMSWLCILFAFLNTIVSMFYDY